MTIGQVAQLWRYPVKSLGGEQIEHSDIGQRGVLGDRLWAVRDLEHDITATARRLPKLLTATARYGNPVSADAGPGNVPEIEITFPDGTVLSSSDREVNANPQARFDRGLDVFTLRNMSSFSTLHALSQMLTTKGGELHGRRILTMHDQPSLTLRADRPVAFQIDGEYVGERELVRLTSVPEALRVIA